MTIGYKKYKNFLFDNGTAIIIRSKDGLIEISVDYAWYSLKKINKELRYHHDKITTLEKAKKVLEECIELKLWK